MTCRGASLLLLVTVVNFTQAGTGYGRGKNNGFGHVNGMRRFPRREHSHLERKAERVAERRFQNQTNRVRRLGLDRSNDECRALCAVTLAAVCLPVFGTYWLIQNANAKFPSLNSETYFVKN